MKGILFMRSRNSTKKGAKTFALDGSERETYKREGFLSRKDISSGTKSG